MDDKLYLSINDTCQLLGVSRPTFNKIRKERKLTEIIVGKRVRFIREEVEKLLAGPKPTLAAKEGPKVALAVNTKDDAYDLLEGPGKFDLRKIRRFDPHGVLNLFCTVAQLACSGQDVSLEVEDSFICNHLRALGFFVQLEKLCGSRVNWNRDVMTTTYEDVRYPIPLTNFQLEKQEAPIVEKLIKLLRVQGFSEAIGGFIGWIIGELVDNSMTHLVHNGAAADAFLLAQRFVFDDLKSNCVMIGVADIGPGIHSTLKTNPKYSSLSDKQAFLSAFRPGFSCWTEYERGKGLTDVLTIAMGNESILRVESGSLCAEMNFRANTRKLSVLKSTVPGTRFTLELIDHDFKPRTRDEVDAYITSFLGEI